MRGFSVFCDDDKRAVFFYETNPKSILLEMGAEDKGGGQFIMDCTKNNVKAFLDKALSEKPENGEVGEWYAKSCVGSLMLEKIREFTHTDDITKFRSELSLHIIEIEGTGLNNEN